MGPIPRQETAIDSQAASATATMPPHITNSQDAVDTSMADAPAADTQGCSASNQNTKKRKRKEKEIHILHQTTLRKPTWAYFHLILITPGTAAQQPSSSTSLPKTQAIDALTVSALISQPLTAYLGTTGSAIPIDILHTQDRSAYVRLPRQDARAFRAGLSGWIGGCDAESIPGVEEGGRVRVAWRIVSEGGSLGLLKGRGEELFEENEAAY